MQPLVSILFPCYNAESYLVYSLESIINQDYKNLEIICINDGSKDDTLSILERYKKLDNRIIVISNERNLGLIASLNKSLEYVKGEYFARMDADDYSTPNRISSQLEFILKNRDFDLVSSGYNYFRTEGTKNEYEAPVAKSSNALMFLSIFSPPLNHASVLGKTSLIKSGKYIYDPNYPHAEDFELFSRLVWSGSKITALTNSLYWIRLNPNSVSVVYNTIQINTNIKIVKRNLEEFMKVKLDIDNETLKIIANKIDFKASLEQIKKSFKLLKLFYSQAESKIKFSEKEKKEINKYLAVHKLNIIIQANKYRFKMLGIRNVSFLISSFGSLNVNQSLILVNKLTKRIKHG